MNFSVYIRFIIGFSYMSEKSPNRLEYICDQCDNWYESNEDIIVSYEDNMYMDFLKNTFVLFHKRKEFS